MLLANETVASYLEAQEAPALYRVHEEPDVLKVAKFEEFISGFGYSLGAPLTALRPRHFQKLLERIHGKPEEKPIAFLMLRTMQKARYAPENLGHFGLAASSYTHFTSPIRRYPDLVVHRALRAARHGLLTTRTREEWPEDLPEVARHTSEMERRADDAERELLQWKKVKFMADKVGDEFEGYVTGVAAFGLFVELDRALRRRAGPRLDDGRRLLPVRRERAHAARREHAEGLPARRQGARCRSFASTWSVRQIDLGLVEILERVREQAAPRRPGGRKATPKARAADAQAQRTRPGKTRARRRERHRSKPGG